MTHALTIEELTKAFHFFPPGAHEHVRRLLDRARAKAVAAARRGIRDSSGKRIGFRTRSRHTLAVTLGRAMRQRGKAKRRQSSVRPTSPKTGGRSFHFSFTTIGKGEASQAGKTAKAAGGKAHAKTSAAKHMTYIERSAAVERVMGVVRGAVMDEPLRDGGHDRGGVASTDAERDSTGRSGAGAGQGYIENATKLALVGETISSFGTIGETAAERLNFWQLVEDHEPHPDARIQQRLILELPHEATPQQRLEMVQVFCRDHLEARGLPFWACLHAPTKDNDVRNYHAHIIFSDRPARRMHDDDGVETWDFAIVREKRKKSGNIMRQHPHRQNKDEFLRKKDAVPKLRVAFAEAVNGILRRDEVKGKNGMPVLYDPLSYKDMGLDVVPLPMLNRIAADKAKTGKVTVFDPGYNKAVLEAEVRQAAERHDTALLDLVRIETAIADLAKAPVHAARINKQLPPEMRVSCARVLIGYELRMAGKAVLKAQRTALAETLVEQTVRASLDCIVETTDPDRVASSHERTRDPERKAELPDVEAARVLHAAALEEIAAFEEEVKVLKRRSKVRNATALAQWQDVTSFQVEQMSGIMMDAIEAAQAPTVVQGLVPVKRQGERRQQERRAVMVKRGRDGGHGR